MDMETGVKPQASVSTLSMTLGLFALGIAWRNAAKMFSIPPAIGETILLLTGCLWLFLLSRYIHQILSSSNGVSRELLLQLQNPFLTLIPITGEYHEENQYMLTGAAPAGGVRFGHAGSGPQ